MIFKSLNCILGYFSARRFFASTPNLQSTIRYVRQNGTGDGRTWDHASGDLQRMINQSAPGDLVFVAQGIYKPTNISIYNDVEDIRNNAFILKAGVKIYGGFPDNRAATWADRNWKTCETVLSGDIKGNNLNNIRHVVIAANIPANDGTTLDGFTITGGNADERDEIIEVNGEIIKNNSGGGIYNIHSSPTIANVSIRGNKAIEGGGLFNESSSPVLVNVLITENSALDSGAGMANTYFSSPTLVNVNICENKSSFAGGGMVNHFSCSPKLINVSIKKNKAKFFGGGIYNVSSSFSKISSVIRRNKAQLSNNVDNNGIAMF